MKISRRSALIAASSAVLARPAFAQKSADTLRIQFVDAVPNVDMYFNSQRTGLILAHQAWDMLVHRDPATFDIKPSLATEWKFADASTLDLTIRQGVKFHDGSTLSPDDVVYTLNMVADPASKVATPSNYSWIDKAEKTGDWTVRISMKRPTPAALEYLAMVTPIHPKAYREKVGPEGFSAKPVGAGPYKIVKNVQGQEVVFERFEDYWAGSPKGKPAIKTLQVRFVPDLATEVTQLLAKQVDWIWNINPDQMVQINKMPHLQAVQQESMRIGYLSIDAAGRSGKDNPLTKLKVRQAIWHAVNRKEFADKLVQGGSRVPPAPCFPSQFGCDADAAVKYDYDPKKAKALLAEAGYPDGFEIEMLTYIQPTSWPAAVQNYLGGRRHPGQDQPAPGLAGDRQGPQGRGAALHGKLGQLFDQRRVGDPAGDVRQGRARQLLAGSRAREADRRGRQHRRQGSARQGLLRRREDRDRAGLLAAALHLRKCLRLRQGTRLQDLPRRAAALLLRQVEVTRITH